MDKPKTKKLEMRARKWLDGQIKIRGLDNYAEVGGAGEDLADKFTPKSTRVLNEYVKETPRLLEDSALHNEDLVEKNVWANLLNLAYIVASELYPERYRAELSAWEAEQRKRGESLDTAMVENSMWDYLAR